MQEFFGNFYYSRLYKCYFGNGRIVQYFGNIFVLVKFGNFSGIYEYDFIFFFGYFWIVNINKEINLLQYYEDLIGIIN